jgi:hypothetical protein
MSLIKVLQEKAEAMRKGRFYEKEAGSTNWRVWSIAFVCCARIKRSGLKENYTFFKLTPTSPAVCTGYNTEGAGSIHHFNTHEYTGWICQLDYTRKGACL